MVLPIDDPRWDERLAAGATDIYHSAGYHGYAAASGEGEPHLVVVGDRRRGVGWPYLLRRVAEVPGLEQSDATDVTSVYGYPGPVAWGCMPGDPFVEDAWGEILGVWRRQRAVAAFTRFNPLLGNAAFMEPVRWPSSQDTASEGVVPGGQTVAIDLTQDDASIRSGYARDVRADVAASRNAGMETREDEAWSYLGEFARLYRATMIRSGADDYYFWGAEQFASLRDHLGGRLHLLTTWFDGDIAAAGLFTEHAGIVESYLVGVNSEHLQKRSPYKVLLDDTRQWAQRRGNRVMHLGGGRGGKANSLFWFKSRFSPQRLPFCTGRWILDRAGYADLVEAHAAAGSDGVGSVPSFFPAYRARITRSETPAVLDPEAQAQ